MIFLNYSSFLFSGTDIKGPQISQATAAHPSVDNQARLLAGLLRVHHCCVALARRRQKSICDRYIPADNTGASTELQGVEIIQVPENQNNSD